MAIFNKTQFRSAKVFIETDGEDGSGNDVIETATMHIVHDGSNIRSSVFGIVQSDANQTSQFASSTGYGVSIVGNDISLKLRPAVNGVNYSIKAHWQAFAL